DGNDTMSGGLNDDLVSGDAGDDLVSGDAGNDLLFGGAGNDQIAGGDGSDQIEGDAGNDALPGGTGADLCVFGQGSGVDTIKDFNNTQDLIDLRDFHFANFGTLMSLAHQDGLNTVIDLNTDAGDQLTLVGVQLATLQHNDFLV